LLLTVTAVRHHQPGDLAVLAGPLVISAVLAQRFTGHLRRTPAGFPAPTASTGLRVTPVSRTRWASDHRRTP
jgi:hypothetical protein